MIDIEDKRNCTSCSACYNICPKNAIEMIEDKEGFKYPVVNKKLCIECKMCEKICPVINKNKKEDKYQEPIVIAAQSKDTNIRLDSTSGGLYTEIAKSILKQNGYICGAVYDEYWMVKHILTNDDKELEHLRSSKYLQSDINNIYSEIKSILQQGKKVLMCGSPCQIAGLNNYLGKAYENLYTCDFICRGMNSPKIFKGYINNLESKYKSKITKIKFKNKIHGWHNFSTKIDFANGNTYIGRRYEDSYMVGYLKYNAFMRPSCYTCHFKDVPRNADITLADFWGIEEIDPTLDDNKGTSLLLLNSSKGEEVFENIKNNIRYKKIISNQVFNGNMCMNNSPELTQARKEVFENIDKYNYKELCNRYFPTPTIMQKVKLRVRESSLFQKNIKPIYLKYIKGSR